MSYRKGQNSIIFLATLGVYLGLVLAGGAAPQVYAYAATTRAFDAREEIEIGDDFFGPPDGEDRSDVSQSLGVYVEDVEQLVNAIRRLGAEGRFTTAADLFEVRQDTYLPCIDSNREGSYTPRRFVAASESLRPALARFSSQTAYGYSLGDCVENKFYTKPATDSQAEFKLDAAGLKVRVKVKRSSIESAAALVATLSGVGRAMLAREAAPLRKEVLRNTAFWIDNDQVTVITRLPRAALEPPLASDAPQR
ncbi:MAG: hypothetical protein ACK4S4_11080 [Pyrinomonadaceae bacterium]